MNKIVRSVALACVVILAAPLAVAQGMGSGPYGGGGMTGGMQSNMNLLGVLAGLHLTEEQRDEISALIRDFVPRIQDAMMEVSAISAEFQQTLRDSGYNEALLVPIAEAQGDAITALILLRAELEGEIMSILTQEQLDLLDTLGSGHGDGDMSGCDDGMGGRGRGCDNRGSGHVDNGQGNHGGMRP